jgi:hypothetical protein
MRKESFHLDGKIPVKSDKFKMCRIGDFSPLAKYLTKKGRTPSFPGLYIEHAKPNAVETITIGWVRHIFSI